MSLILKPGEYPPEMWCYCERCDQPVERMQFDLTDGGDHIGIHSQCCGYTSSTRISSAVYLRMMATGEKLYTIVKKGSTAGLKAMKARAYQGRYAQ